MTDKALLDDITVRAATIRLAAAERVTAAHIEDAARLETYLRSLERIALRAATDRQSFSWQVAAPLRWLERVAGRKKPSPPLSPLSNSADAPRVVFVNGCTVGESQRYRIRNLISGLRKLGVSSTEVTLGDCRRIIYQGMQPEVVVFFRALNTAEKNYSDVVEQLKSFGTKVVFDIDDYVVNPEILDQIDSYRQLAAEEQKSYANEILGYLSMMRLCGRATAATPYLAAAMESLGVPTHHVTNSFNDEQLARAVELSLREKRRDGPFRISYLSGSATHRRDFQECESALLEFLQKHPEVTFTLVGFLDLGQEWNRVSSQVKRMPFMGYIQTLDVLNDSDITIACLEEASEFCQSKSELKYFESALVRTPTLASRTAAYSSAIKNGQNGLLASSHSEWLSNLEAVFNSASLGQDLGNQAYASVIQRYSETYAARQALSAYGIDIDVAQ